jgi:hypothetical protein
VSAYRGPYSHRPGATLDEESRRALLDQALAGVDLGSYDSDVVDWLASRPTPVVRSVAGLIERRSALRPQRVQVVPDDLLAVLRVVRGALDRGLGDVALGTLNIVIESQGRLRLGTRTMAKILAAHLDEGT